ncbi:MAG: hypothetical protein WC785_08650 [Tatlockia sp.]|jgi:hypothetical protein
MSLFNCLDYIKKITLKPLKKDSEKAFFKKLKARIETRIKDDNYVNLERDINFIDNYTKNHKYSPYLQKIRNEFTCIDERRNNKKQKNLEILPAFSNQESQKNRTSFISEKKVILQKFQPHLIAKIIQGENYRLGSSLGECYGFTFAMADPQFSPYKNPELKTQNGRIPKINLNEAVHNYQRGQKSRAQDQQTVKKTRITRRHFCPDYRTQAEEIYAVAEKVHDSDYYLRRRFLKGSHATYLASEVMVKYGIWILILVLILLKIKKILLIFFMIRLQNTKREMRILSFMSFLN